MRVSIVIPVYNGANYLREAIDSALAQTYRDVEVLVVNDGSTDGGATDAIARSYGGRIRYIAKPNGGVSSALNAGLAGMTGEWFCWLSHDDRFLPRKTEVQAAFARAHPAVRAIGCNFDLIDEQGRVVETVRETIDQVRTGRDVLRTWIYGCALMIHRGVFDLTGPFNESNRTTQDLEMWLRVVEHTEIAWIPDVLCQRREHPEMGSHTDVRFTSDKDDLFRRIVARYETSYFDPDARVPRERAETWFLVARDAQNRGALRGARRCLARAWREWRSPRNPALPRLLFGIRVVTRLRHYAGRIRARLPFRR